MSYRAVLLLLIPSIAASCTPRSDSPHWYKGNTHTHTLWSDGDDFPESVVQWYRDRDYHFLALSDHNVLSQGEKWFSLPDFRKRQAMEAVNKYLNNRRFSPHTQGHLADGSLKVRLRTLEEIRPQFERPGQFLMIPAEEISATLDKTPIHINAINLAELIKPQTGNTISEVISNNLRAIREQSERLNRPILPHVNHPNFQWALTAEDLASITEDRFFEVYNGHPGVNHRGDDKHIPVETMWDIANTIRLTRLGAPPLYGLACDDSHHYHRPGLSRSSSGRGWIMVRANALTPDSLIAAMRQGDFYASSGVTLNSITYDPTSKTLSLDIHPDKNAAYTTHFIGTCNDFDRAGSNAWDFSRVGAVLATVQGPRPSYTLTGHELYVRAVVTSSKPADVPVFAHQRQQAWTQPIGWTFRPTP